MPGTYRCIESSAGSFILSKGQHHATTQYIELVESNNCFYGEKRFWIAVDCIRKERIQEALLRRCFLTPSVFLVKKVFCTILDRGSRLCEGFQDRKQERLQIIDATRNTGHQDTAKWHPKQSKTVNFKRRDDQETQHGHGADSKMMSLWSWPISFHCQLACHHS